MIERENVKKLVKNWKWIAFSAASVFFCLFALTLVWWETRPPIAFPTKQAVEIKRGLSASAVADHLAERNVVKSANLLYLLLVWQFDPNNIKAGSYVFDQPVSLWKVAKRITAEAPPDALVVLTLPEGFSARDYAKIVKQSLPEFATAEFLDLARTEEGYLFPDTYNIPSDFTPSELIALLLATYQHKTAVVQKQMMEHELGEYGVLTLASLLEREANSPESQRKVAGVLFNRLNKGMRLQVDASLEYVLDKALGDLTPEDLKVDSPYNTYRYDGLPPTPIGNPGLVAIEAVLNPLESDYYYYITDDEGEFYFAKTFEEHKKNIERYLR